MVERIKIEKRIPKQMKQIRYGDRYKTSTFVYDAEAQARLKQRIQQLFDEGGTHDGTDGGIPRFLYRSLWVY